GSDGSYADLLIIPGGGSRKPFSQEVLDKREAFIKMEGNEVFKVAVQKMLESAVKTCERAQIKPEELKLFIPHQANLRIINAVAKRLRLREEQVFINLDRIGNISAATIPVALAEADEKGLLRSGDLLAMVAFGGGFTWAGMSLRW
ncbi:MAG TPA: 3-oxoacyl-[acyl-carrier-protein] synthase III C-terminal domain-containing protein, partial [bacterium]|nr:3-oxoacyl-[acyl-carrier-protein] synthase III C-terminal domain-containing protein [bacterium]